MFNCVWCFTKAGQTRFKINEDNLGIMGLRHKKQTNKQFQALATPVKGFHAYLMSFFFFSFNFVSTAHSSRK